MLTKPQKPVLQRLKKNVYRMFPVEFNMGDRMPSNIEMIFVLNKRLIESETGCHYILPFEGRPNTAALLRFSWRLDVCNTSNLQPLILVGAKNRLGPSKKSYSNRKHTVSHTGACSTTHGN